MNVPYPRRFISSRKTQKSAYSAGSSLEAISAPHSDVKESSNSNLNDTMLAILSIKCQMNVLIWPKMCVIQIHY